MDNKSMVPLYSTNVLFYVQMFKKNIEDTYDEILKSKIE